MKPMTKVTLLILALVAAGIMAALMREATENPTFRPADYASLQECLRNIPTEWLEGSLERTGAETSCGYVHAPAAPR